MANVTSLSADIVNPIKPLSNLVVKNDVTLFIPELMDAVQKQVYLRGSWFRTCRSCSAGDVD
jgi:hypothetical protein